MKARFKVEKTIKFTDHVDVDLSHIDDDSKDQYVRDIVADRDPVNQTFQWENVEIVDVSLLKGSDIQFHENLDKVGICKLYPSLEELHSALDSCWDLHELGVCDHATQKEYAEMAEMKALELYGWWMKAKGDVNFIDYPYEDSNKTE